MHEMSLAAAAIDLAAEQATRGLVTALWLGSAASPASTPTPLPSARVSEAAAKGTVAQGAQLHFQHRRQRPGVTTATRRSPSPRAGRPAPAWRIQITSRAG